MKTTRLLLWLPVVRLLCACAGTETLEPTYEGCATDENWQTLDAYEQGGGVKTDDALGPRWLEPMAGAALAKATPARFRWQPSTQDAGKDRGSATCEKFPPLRAGSSSLLPQHEPPVSGNLFDLHFAVGGKDVYRVLTTQQIATPPLGEWQAWAGQTVTVDLVSAALSGNAVVTGPYRATLSFQVD